MITKIDSNSVTFEYKNKKFMAVYNCAENLELPVIRDITDYGLDYTLPILYGNSVIVINKELGFYNEEFYFKIPNKFNEFGFCYDDILSNEKYDLPFKYDKIYLALTNCSTASILPIVDDESYNHFTHHEKGTIIHDPDLIPIIQKLSENERNQLIEILKQYNLEWLRKTYKTKKWDYEYEISFDLTVYETYINSHK